MTALLTPHTGADPDRAAPAADPDHPGSDAGVPGSNPGGDGLGGRRHARRPALPVVTTILSVRDVGPWLPQTLDALAAQNRPPERLLVYVPTAECADLVRAHAALAAAVPDLHITELTDTDERLAGELTRIVPRALADSARRTGAAVMEGTAGASERGAELGEEWLWLLTDGPRLTRRPWPSSWERCVAPRRSALPGRRCSIGSTPAGCSKSASW